ncbi:MAG: hypothetical protein A2428_02010 [Bdellovibrionales bacterium RIFOXYC1_FULL_54_43]|nr:MAG: hypothetical protein A2428_02010 [Bdellovibrionales bacterium RIFOXYC1_FULL_54_43]OFZ79824.1 MAG: hypothetical protein A2603_05735 [Bdellovibrionales bacterium RIFOXYD1_FULL_55_31]
MPNPNLNSKKIRTTLLALLALGGATACNGGAGAGAGAIDGTNGAVASHQNIDNGTQSADGITLALRYVSYLNQDGQPVISEARSRQIVDRVNQIYAPCNIRFVLEEYLPVTPKDRGLEFGLSSMSDIEPTRAAFDEPNRVVVVNTGAWDHSSIGSANAWTAMPGTSPSGVVLESDVAENAEIVAHELGHHLNLDHVDDPANLENPIIYSTSTFISASQCSTMRQSAQGIRSASLR